MALDPKWEAIRDGWYKDAGDEMTNYTESRGTIISRTIP